MSSITVGIVGAGTMGVGVAQVFATAGHPVVVADPVDGALEAGERRLAEGLRAARLLGGRVADGTERRLRWTTDLTELQAARFVVECVPERLPVKEKVFRELDAVCPSGTVFASCTSALPVAVLAGHTGRADRVLATHFMNPAPLKDTVEVVRGPDTAESTLRTTLDLLAGAGLRAHVVADAPGFVSNRVLMPMVNDAAARVQEGVADADTVDRIFQDCFGHPMGPLRTADLIGLDTIVDTLHVLADTTGDPRYEPCDLLRELVRRGHLGRKSGQGFHRYARHGKQS